MLYLTLIRLLKMVTTIPEEKFDFMGRAGAFFRDDHSEKGIVDTYDASYFTSANKQDKLMLSHLKEHGLSMTVPLLLGIASLDAYLLDDTIVRLRLEIANKSWMLNTHEDGNSFKFILDSAKLWVDRVVPHVASLESLNLSCVECCASKAFQYTYNRSLYKSYVLGINQSSLLDELPFSSIIP